MERAIERADRVHIMHSDPLLLKMWERFGNKKGKPYGSWGITALEAAAMGKVVFTQMNNPSLYEKTYGCLPELMCYNDKSEFIDNLQSLIDSPSAIRVMQKLTREWVVKHHSFESTGKKMLDLFGGI